MSAFETPAPHGIQYGPALQDRRTDLTLRQQFAAAKRVVRFNSPRESVQCAYQYGLERLQRLFPDVPRVALAKVVEMVWRRTRHESRAEPSAANHL